MKFRTLIILGLLYGGIVWWSSKRTRWDAPWHAITLAADDSFPTQAATVSNATSDFRQTITAALKLRREDCLLQLSEFLTRSNVAMSDADAEWFFELFLKEEHVPQPAITIEHWLAVINTWSLARPQRAADFLAQRGRLDGPEGTLLMTVWASHNPLDAIAWGSYGELLHRWTFGREDSSTEGPYRPRADWLAANAKALAETWAAADLDGLLAYAAKGGREPDGPTVVAALISQRSITALAAWLEEHGGQSKLLPEAIRSAATTAIVSNLSASAGPDAAKQWVARRQAPEDLRAGLAILVPQLTHQEPRQTLDWLESISSQKGYSKRFGEMAINEWAAQDPLAAGAWVNAHQSSPYADSYIWGYAMQLALEDPPAARAWAKTLRLKSARVEGSYYSRLPGDQGQDPREQMEFSGPPNAVNLERTIAAAEEAVRMLHDPQRVSVDTDGPPLAYMPIMVRERPGAAPQLRMSLRIPGAAAAAYQGAWSKPFPIYVRQPDGSLRYESTPTRR